MATIGVAVRGGCFVLDEHQLTDGDHMTQRMRPAAEIVAEMNERFSEAFEGADGRECLVCRIAFGIFKGFLDVSYAQTMHHQTGEMIPTSALKALSSGHEMRQAIGITFGCKCVSRPPGRYDERYIVKDDEGNPVANVPYRVLSGGKQIHSGVTDSEGMTERIVTPQLKYVTLELGS
ncbi:hypothetical protein [Paraburkholderia antibiotica]|uniref:Uncharacterized protein n=1 Tax=Paraburkholderia antibiotica TaxID=2728839 RepID=A0A7Y0A288_9BURK|nr:hypothetical protein [Paraburkholderia antibiotica]NML35190.1 hypothetical protein [Paraburkholderia antibiotica]